MTISHHIGAETAAAAPPPLVVDLDGTLIR